MKKGYIISLVCTLLLLAASGSALAQPVAGCAQAADETSRLNTARSILKVNMRVGDVDHYDTVINYWAEDVVYKEPVLTNSGRDEMWDYLVAVYGVPGYGFPADKITTIQDEVYETNPDGSMTYLATNTWSGTSDLGFYIQKGMSIMKFRPDEGCPYYHRDYFTEGDTWWNIPFWQSDMRTYREIYIALFGLSGRCFDDDGDGYTKYAGASGCINPGLDCNDFVPGIHPGAAEICDGLGVDEDCDGLIDSADPDCP